MSSSMAQVDHVNVVVAEECNVRWMLESLHNIFWSFKLSHSHESLSILSHSFWDQFCGFCISFCSKNLGLSFLFINLYNIFGSFSLLLCNLLLLNWLSEITRELKTSNRHIIYIHIEFASSLVHPLLDISIYLFPLSEKLVRIVLSDDWFEDFISNRGYNSVIIVETLVIQYLPEFLFLGSVQDSQCQLDWLHVTRARGRVDQLGACPNLEALGLLESWDVEVHALSIDLGLDTSCLVVHEGALTTVNHEEETTRHETTSHHHETKSLHFVQQSFHILDLLNFILNINY